MIEGGLEFLAALIELTELLSGETVEVVAIGTYEMREYGTRNDGILRLQTTNQLIHVFLRITAQTVHSRVQFDLDGPSVNTLLLE